ncbi:hypothetical protein EQH65_23895 [Escherichia coli]|nr:hypothetical protein EQH65_23895 [Escherichia coli]
MTLRPLSKSGNDAQPAEGKPQRGILGFYQGFDEVGAVVDQGGEIHSDIIRKRTIDRVNRSQGQGL